MELDITSKGSSLSAHRSVSLDHRACILEGKMDKEFFLLPNLSTTDKPMHQIDVSQYFEMLKHHCADQNASSKHVSCTSGKELCQGLNLKNNRDPGHLSLLSMRRATSDDLYANMRKHEQHVFRRKFSYDLDMFSGNITLNDRKADEIDDDVYMGREKSLNLYTSKNTKVCMMCSNYADDQPFSPSFAVNVCCNASNVQEACRFDHFLEMPDLCTCGEKLSKRHMADALMHGKIQSVSEQNRKQRRRYFDMEKNAAVEGILRLSHTLDEQLSLS